jgi:hypothetical protein
VDRSNNLFTQVKNIYTTTQLKDASQTFQSTPPEFPSMYFNVLGNESAADDFDNNDNANNMTVEITFYTTGSTKLTTAKSLMKIAEDKMRSKGFRVVFGPREVTNAANTDICRYIARYNRIIGTGDTL